MIVALSGARLCAATVGVIASALMLSGCHLARELRPGPIVVLENESAAVIDVRYWVGRTDVTAPGGSADWHTPRAVTLLPGEKDICAVGDPLWLTANSDALVRLRIEAKGGLYDGSPIRWIEVGKPAPYEIVAMGSEGDLRMESRGEARLKDVPASEWIPGHLDEYPISALHATTSIHGR